MHLLVPLLRLAALLCLAVHASAADVKVLGAPRRGAHFELRAEAADEQAAEWLAVLEAAWPQYKAFFGGEPKLKPGERLQVVVYGSESGFKAALVADGVGAVDAGGIYAFKTRKAYFFRQPSAWYTRALLIHECAHQFHGHLHGDIDRPGWYAEGTVEHLAQHAWDGKELKLGIVAPISLEDYPRKALEQLDAPDFDFKQVLEKGDGFGRPLGMHLVRLLQRQHEKRFLEARKKLDRGDKLAATDWAPFGGAKKLETQLREMLLAEQQPFRVAFVDWDARRADLTPTGPVYALRGSAPQVVSGAYATRESAWFECTTTFPAQGGRVGAQLDWVDGGDYTVFLVDRSGLAYVQRMVPKQGWVDLDMRRPIAAKDGSGAFGTRRIRIERRARPDGSFAAAVLLDGVEHGAYPVRNSHFGPAMDAGVFDFESVRFEPLPATAAANSKPR